jgi:predicted MFS family arabinose efflux permease
MTLNRDRVFWTVALQVAVVNFYLGGFGPAQPLLRTQQHTSLTVAGLHGTAMGIASIIAGLLSPRLVHRFGRASTSWFGIGIFAVGIVMFVFSPPIQLTLIATLIAGFGTLTVSNAMVTQLSHHFPKNQSIAISRASGIASAGYVAGTLTVGIIAGTSLNWRFGLLLVIPASILLYLLARSVIASEHIPDEVGPQKGTLNRNFWISWFGFVACISTEFATTFWAAALLRNRVGSSAAISTICIVAVGGGMGLGRWFGPHVLRRASLDNQLKTVMITQFLGFATLWFSHTLWISLTALFAVGLGISMQFALASLRLIGFSEGRPDLAIGHSSLGSGIAIAMAPFILGALGDHLGISRAYLMVPVLIVIAFSTIIAIPSAQTSHDGLSLADLA